jgi:hypothetical protein
LLNPSTIELIAGHNNQRIFAAKLCNQPSSNSGILCLKPTPPRTDPPNPPLSAQNKNQPIRLAQSKPIKLAETFSSPLTALSLFFRKKTTLFSAELL